MIRVAIIQSKVNSGGVKNLVLEYYRHIDKTKVQFDLICDQGSNAIPYEEWEGTLGGKIYAVTPYRHIFKHVLDVWRIMKSNKYQVVHGFDNMMNVFALGPAFFSGTRVRIAENLSMSNKGEAQSLIKILLRPFDKWFANYLMACGKECGAWAFGKKNIKNGKVAVFKTVINAKFNEYKPELRKSTREKFGWNGAVVYGFIGRLASQKNPLFLAEIFKSLAKKQKNAKLAVIGWGKFEAPLLAKIKEYGLEKNFDFLGRREDIQQFYNAFDAFLLPSLYEGLPVVGLESQACGLPVFFSDGITREASVCELGNFISLDKGSDYWADQIIEKTAVNILVRKSHSQEIIDNGYDSQSEALRLQNYYFNALAEQGVAI